MYLSTGVGHMAYNLFEDGLSVSEVLKRIHIAYPNVSHADQTVEHIRKVYFPNVRY